jgi:hypothetical protein
MNACNEQNKKYINPYITEAQDTMKKDINKQKTIMRKMCYTILHSNQTEKCQLLTFPMPACVTYIDRDNMTILIVTGILG